MKNYLEMDEVSQNVVNILEEQLCDLKKDCKEGILSGDMCNFVTKTVLGTLDDWTPRLTTVIRSEILDWFQSEYGLCL
jgi:hypothetical protein